MHYLKLLIKNLLFSIFKEDKLNDLDVLIIFSILFYNLIYLTIIYYGVSNKNKHIINHEIYIKMYSYTFTFNLNINGYY